MRSHLFLADGLKLLPLVRCKHISEGQCHDRKFLLQSVARRLQLRHFGDDLILLWPVLIEQIMEFRFFAGDVGAQLDQIGTMAAENLTQLFLLRIV